MLGKPLQRGKRLRATQIVGAKEIGAVLVTAPSFCRLFFAKTGLFKKHLLLVKSEPISRLVFNRMD